MNSKLSSQAEPRLTHETVMAELDKPMKLFGIIHERQYLAQQIAEIESISDGLQDKSIMLELAPNHDTLAQQGLLQPNCFMALRDYFSSKCAKIICGDQEITMPDNPNPLIAALLGEDYFWPDNHRDEIMAKTIQTENPDFVIVAGGHSDNLKMQFPHAFYTAFQPKGGYQGHTWYSPNRITTL